MPVDPACPAAGIDYSKISESYGTLTALLAGFAFTALVMILTSRREGRRRDFSKQTDTIVATSLVAAFFGLAIATLTYSVIAGEIIKYSRGRSAMEELAAGLPFGLAAMMLFYCVVALMEDSALQESATRLARFIAVVVVPLIGMSYLVNGVNDTELARLERTDTTAFCGGVVPGLNPLGEKLTYTLLITLPVVFLVGLKFAAWQRLANRMRMVVPITVVAMSVGAAGAVGYLSTAPRDLLLTKQQVDIFLTSSFVLFLLCAIILSPEPPSRPEPVAGDQGNGLHESLDDGHGRTRDFIREQV